MARRQLDEINAGSMADIAFLLLVFFLVVTKMNDDQGMPRLLPPPVFEIEDPPKFIARDVYEILVNLNDELYVEDDLMDVRLLREGAKEFLLANGDNVLSTLTAPIDDLPIRKVTLKMDSIRGEIARKENDLEELVKLQTKFADEDDVDNLGVVEKKIKDKQKSLDATMAIKYALDYFPGFASLPGSAMISVQNDNSCTYNTYVSVNNELEGALNDLRNEVSLSQDWGLYDDLDPEDEEDAKKILAIRVVYPQRISEAEPLDIGGYND